ncbi:hypothetical protein [Amphiplicatus metriothermophilus]|jgi:hypothetical protein|uniref:Uncharacterized protein n=1 Tax=Amphiplicatus metriothermophilus TaxID=1519374 RepID=A0A239PV75_9PROT|nr:hypothetical protein [Amphiplicatus metriothermophilus]MBB5519503.1 hypothetical protein [Amphiplicatus metriothermophilus]SNT74070.1 hypothetical protein SAMN06297382_1974 [Amphiplicatus metriothermophilus]
MAGKRVLTVLAWLSLFGAFVWTAHNLIVFVVCVSGTCRSDTWIALVGVAAMTGGLWLLTVFLFRMKSRRRYGVKPLFAIHVPLIPAKAGIHF